MEHDQIAKKYYQDLWRYIRFLSGDKDATEDLVQESFLRLVSFGGEVKTTRRRLLFGIAVNVVHEWKRKQANLRKTGGKGHGGNDDWSPIEEIESREQRPEQAVAEAEVRERMQQAIQELDPILGKVAHRYLIEGVKIPEIAKQLNLPLSTILCQLKRAKRKLRDLLADNLVAAGGDQDTKPPPDPKSILLGELDGHEIRKHPKERHGKQPFVTWNGCTVSCKSAEFLEMDRESAMALLREKGKIP